MPAPAANAQPTTAPASPVLPSMVQPSLFVDASARPKVVPIPTLTPVRAQAGPRKAPVRSQSTRTSRRGESNDDLQQHLDFYDAPDAPGHAPDSSILCDAPVATPVHRLMAAAVDASMIAIASGLFLGVFYFSGGHIAINKQTFLLALGVVAVIGIFYRTLWSLGNGETPDRKSTRLNSSH